MAKHSSALTPEELRAEFIRSGGEKLRHNRERSVSGTGKRKERNRKIAPKVETEIADAFWHGGKAEHIWHAIQTRGQVECDDCGRVFRTFEAAMKGLHAHHEIFRSQGKRYRKGGGMGVDHPRNRRMKCNRCHKKKHSAPEFGEGAVQ